MRVFAFEDGSACGYYRIKLPFYEMHLNGLDVGYGREGAAPSADVVVGQRVGAAEQLPALLGIWRRARLVFETDDDLWSIDPTNRRAHKAYSPQMLAEVEQVVRMSHMVTVSTPYLAERMSTMNRNVVVLPNCVDPRLFDEERPRRDRLVVGWAGGDSHHLDMAAFAPALGRFFQRNPTVELHTIGWGSEHRPTDFPGYVRPFVNANPLHKAVETYRHTGWSNDIWTYYRSIDFDIGIAPLVDNLFNRSKSAIKALEYAALGIPVVASDVEPYREFVVDGVTGRLVKHAHEWDRALRDLVNDEAMRTEMGAAAREHARTWSIERRWHEWAAAYQSLL